MRSGRRTCRPPPAVPRTADRTGRRLPPAVPGRDRLLSEFREFHQFAPRSMGPSSPRHVPDPREIGRRQPLPEDAEVRPGDRAAEKDGVGRFRVVPPQARLPADRRRKRVSPCSPSRRMNRDALSRNGVISFVIRMRRPARRFRADFRRGNLAIPPSEKSTHFGTGGEDPGSPTRTFRSPRTAAPPRYSILCHTGRQAYGRRSQCPSQSRSAPVPRTSSGYGRPSRSTLSRTTPQTSAPAEPRPEPPRHRIRHPLLLPLDPPRTPFFDPVGDPSSIGVVLPSRM